MVTGAICLCPCLPSHNFGLDLNLSIDSRGDPTPWWFGVIFLNGGYLSRGLLLAASKGCLAILHADRQTETFLHIDVLAWRRGPFCCVYCVAVDSRRRTTSDSVWKRSMPMDLPSGDQ